MGLSSDAVLDVLRAVGEDTRLRIVALLRHGELTVTDLTDILGQSQPRISRHLKLLAEAGVVDKHREGTWAFFELVGEGPIAELVADLLARVEDHDAVTAIDLDRLEVVRGRRAAAAQEYFAGVADHWDEERSLHAADAVVEAAILDLAAERRYRSVLDLGTGTGRMLQLLAKDGVDRAVGIDNSHSMLAVARANLERAEVRIAAHQDDFDHAVIEREHRFLRHDGQPAGQRSSRERRHVGAAQPDLTGRGPQRPGDQPQQRGLSRPVRPQDSGERAFGDAERHLVENPAAARVRKAEVNGFQ